LGLALESPIASGGDGKYRLLVVANETVGGKALLDEIQRLVPGYDFNRLSLFVGSDVRTNAIGKGLGTQQDPKLIKPAHNSLFESRTFGRYSQVLASVMEKHRNTELTVTR